MLRWFGGFLGQCAGKVVRFVCRMGRSDVLIVGGSVSLFYGLYLYDVRLGFVVIGVIWMVIGLVAAWLEDRPRIGHE